MAIKENIYFFTFLLFISFKLHSQFCTGPLTSNCSASPTSSISISSVSGTNQNLNFDFDSFSKINGGIVQYGSSIIKIKVSEAIPASCNWTLKMYVSSTAVAPEWDALTNYGSVSGILPPLSLIDVRVNNGCSTPQSFGVWQNFAAAQGAFIDIINNAVITASTVPCTVGSEVNGPGSYLTNYNAYTFTVDYRIILAGFTYRPGRYTLKIEYCLSER